MDENRKIVQDAVLAFIDKKCKEAAVFFCKTTNAYSVNDKNANRRDVIMNTGGISFYSKYPEIFELQTKIKENMANFNKFTPTEKALWFGLDPTIENIRMVRNLIFKYKPDLKYNYNYEEADNYDSNIDMYDSVNVQSLIYHNISTVDSIKNKLEYDNQMVEECVITVYTQLKKIWVSESERISDIYDKSSGLTPEFYDTIYHEVIYPKIQLLLKEYASLKNIPYIPLPLKRRKQFSSIQEKFSVPFQSSNISDKSIQEQFSVPFQGLDAAKIKKHKKTLRQTRKKQKKHYSKKRYSFRKN